MKTCPCFSCVTEQFCRNSCHIARTQCVCVCLSVRMCVCVRASKPAMTHPMIGTLKKHAIMMVSKKHMSMLCRKPPIMVKSVLVRIA